MSRGGVALAVTALLAVTACASDPESPSSRKARPTASTSTTPTATERPCDPMRQRTDDADPAAPPVPLAGRRMLPDRKGSAAVLSVSSSGEVLQEIGRRDTPGGEAAEDEASLHPGTLSVLDPATGRSQQVRGRNDVHDGTQTVFAALDDDYAVWTEETGTSLNVAEWAIYAADRSSSEISKVAESQPVKELGATPTVPGYTIPSLNAGRVYWAEARSNPRRGRPPVVNVYGRRLGSAQPAELVAENAVLPVATGDWLYYAAFDPVRFNRPEYAIYRKNLATGDTGLVHRDDVPRDGSAGRAAFLTAYGDTVAWSLAQTVEVFSGTKDVEHIAHVEGTGQALSWLSSGPGTIGFNDASEQGGNYLLDLRSGCLHNLGSAPGLSQVKIAGRHVLWAGASDGSPQAHMAWRYARLR